jgi:hypothetical protein
MGVGYVASGTGCCNGLNVRQVRGFRMGDLSSRLGTPISFLNIRMRETAACTRDRFLRHLICSVLSPVWFFSCSVTCSVEALSLYCVLHTYMYNVCMCIILCVWSL